MDWKFDGTAPSWLRKTPPGTAFLCRHPLIPKDDVYLVPLKVALRRPEGVDDGDIVRVRLSVGR